MEVFGTYLSDSFMHGVQTPVRPGISDFLNSHRTQSTSIAVIFKTQQHMIGIKLKILITIFVISSIVYLTSVLCKRHRPRSPSRCLERDCNKRRGLGMRLMYAGCGQEFDPDFQKNLITDSYA